MEPSHRTYRMVTKKPETRMVVIGCTAIKKYNKSLLLCLNLKMIMVKSQVFLKI